MFDTLYAGVMLTSEFVTVHVAVPAVVSALYPSFVQLSIAVNAFAVTAVIAPFVLYFCVSVGCVALFTPELKVIVLVYTAYKYSFLSVVFPTLYAGLWLAVLVVTAYVASPAVVSALYPVAAHPLSKFVNDGAGRLIADTA